MLTIRLKLVQSLTMVVLFQFILLMNLTQFLKGATNIPQNCFQTYPFALSDPSSSMYFTTGDMDNLSNIILGGTIDQVEPFLSYFSPNPSLSWQKQMPGLSSGQYPEVTVVKFQHQIDASPYILVLLTRDSYRNASIFLQIETQTGTLVQSFQEYTSYQPSSQLYYGILGQITSQRLLYLTTGDIYVTGVSMYDNKLNFARFSILSSVISIQTMYSSTTTQSKGMALTMTQDQNYVLLGAEFEQFPTYELSIHKTQRGDLSAVQWEIYVEIYGPLQDLQIAHFGTTNDYIFGSMTYQDLANFEYVDSIFYVEYISSTQELNAKFVDLSSLTYVYQCLSIYVVSKTEAYFLFWNTYNDHLQLMYSNQIYDLGTTTVMTVEQKVIANFDYKLFGIIKSTTNVYFGGTRIPNAQTEAFYESFYNATLCQPSSYAYTIDTNLEVYGVNYTYTNAIIGAGVTSRLNIAPVPLRLINYIASLSVFITNDPHSSCLPLPTFPTLLPRAPVMLKRIIYIKPGEDFHYIPTLDFTGDELCSDKQRSYSLIPPSINVTIDQNTGLITYLAANQVHGIDQSINVQVQQIDGKLAAISYPIDFIDCRDVYITELLIENQVFVLNQEMTQTLIYKAPIYSKDMCSQYIELTVTFRNGSVIPSSFMSSDLANNMLIFNTSEQSYLGIYSLQFQLKSLINIGNILSTVPFEISIIDICQVQYKYPGPQTFTYYLGRLEKISFQDLEFYSNCDYSISIKPYTNPGYPLPSYIRYSSEFQEFNIYTNDQNQKGIHQILIKATLETDRKIENSTFIWTLIIEDDPIQFGFSLELSNQIVFVGQESFYELPLVVNPFNESYEIKTEISMIQSFAKFDGSTFSFFPYLMDIGEYTLEVSLLNLRRPQKSKLYNFKLKVNQLNFTNTQTQQVYKREIEQAQNFKQNFKAKIKSISFKGLLTVQFYDDWLYSEINQNFLNIKIEYRFLQRSLDSSLYERNDFIQDWKYVQYKNKILQVQLNFSRPSYISNFREKDILELKFSYQFSNLKTYLRRQLVEGDSTQNQYVIKKEIPQQLDQDEALAIAQTGNAISAAMTASVYFNFILQFFLSAALSIIWGALNNLQLITHLPLFQINFTSNFRYFVLFLIDISNLNLIPTPDFLTENLQFNQEDTIDEDYQLEDMYQLLGYESCFFPSNLANLIVNFLAIVAFMAVERIIQRGLSQKQQKLETVQINTEKDMLNTAYQDYQSRIILDQQ
eukprot:403354273